LKSQLDSFGLWQGKMAGSSEHGNEPSGFIKTLETSLVTKALLSSQQRLHSRVAEEWSIIVKR
jgi:hypothetical protein